MPRAAGRACGATGVCGRGRSPTSLEDIGILLRYATGRDYYDRRSIVSKH